MTRSPAAAARTPCGAALARDRLTGGADVDAFDGGTGTDRATDRVAGETLVGVELLGP